LLCGYEVRLGWLKAAALLIFGATLAAWGLQAIGLPAGVVALARVGLFLLRRN
jgi:hypothetical protein